MIRLFKEFHGHCKEFKILFERFGVLSSPKAAELFQYCDEMKNVFKFLDGKYTENEMNVSFIRMRDLCSSNINLKIFFKYDKIIDYMKGKAKCKDAPTPLKKRSPVKKSTPGTKKTGLAIDPSLVEVLDDSDPSDAVMSE